MELNKITAAPPIDVILEIVGDSYCFSNRLLELGVGT